MLGYFDCVFAWANEDGFYFFPDEDDKGKSKLNGAKSTYAQYGNETPLILYDSTLGKSGKSGFLITNKRLYMKDVEKPIVLSLHDAIRDIYQGKNPANNCDYLYFGEHGVHLLHAGEMVEDGILGDFIELIISLILFLTVLKPKEIDLWKAVEHYQHLPRHRERESNVHHVLKVEEVVDTPEVCYCFECGAENEAGDRFCCECGAELI